MRGEAALTGAGQAQAPSHNKGGNMGHQELEKLDEILGILRPKPPSEKAEWPEDKSINNITFHLKNESLMELINDEPFAHVCYFHKKDVPDMLKWLQQFQAAHRAESEVE